MLFIGVITFIATLSTVQEAKASSDTQLHPEAFYQPKGGSHALELKGMIQPEAKFEIFNQSTGEKLGDVHAEAGYLFTGCTDSSGKTFSLRIYSDGSVVLEDTSENTGMKVNDIVSVAF